MSYFKAVVLMSTENLWLNHETGDYEGTDPDTFQDNGIIRTFTSDSIENIKDQLTREFFKNWELYIEDDGSNACLQMSQEGEHDYRTPKEDRIPFIENYTVYITHVVETPISEDVLKTFTKETK